MNPRLTSKLDELKGDEISFGEIVDQDPPIMGDPQALRISITRTSVLIRSCVGPLASQPIACPPGRVCLGTGWSTHELMQ
jgi:hypothetical protein